MTNVMKDAISKVREVIPLSTVFRQFDNYEILTTRGNDVIIACPFHVDKSPSLSINDALMRWHCFGCGRGGDVIAAYAELSALVGNPMNYYTALRTLVQSTPAIGVSIEQLRDRKVLTMNNNTKVFRWKPTQVKTWSELYRIMPKKTEALYAVLDLMHSFVPLETIYAAFEGKGYEQREENEEFCLEME